ncbi:MAG: hypothetical protein US57_C0002G0045 [Candidatus Moranbacteria bacterium GW2011_GWC2_37_73]|nr:MAG: hypothetical protein UR95_C0002G0143 [Parcubacteria group bacterium GW2011_GWC1_36_108]KKQ01014.1 MAG: hypothetical protein US09_C0003G0014 [Candidatus Moranbacteria bacterium GW2011_GWD1_36_198]KKQ02416.1 MAG: hypothetical protein US10_C0001G0014 [Candidatus Moranbacteria bacterium GW2011_GWD2_36_198]KKQ40338.1 MAG: hypothetical protein US57_C0002G0045 [Candidatus Moranbacteria bacterium GW2011_GWC2_37_73]HBU10691.1 hypothetical protein [Candidatus Moranbacteria bacterium]
MKRISILLAATVMVLSLLVLGTLLMCGLYDGFSNLIQPISWRMFWIAVVALVASNAFLKKYGYK